MTGGVANKAKYSLIKKQNIVSKSSSDMTGGAANKETKYSLNSSSDDWRSC